MKFRRAILVVTVALAMMPVGAASAGQVDGGLKTGMYPQNDIDSRTTLNGVAAASGQKVTFGGTFLDMYNDNSDPTDINVWSATRTIFESIWAAQATPFANVGIGSASAASIANGNHDGIIDVWIQHLQSFLDLGGERSAIIAPFPEHNGNWTPYGCDPKNHKTAFQRIVNAVRAAGIDETEVRFAWVPNGWTSPGCGSLKDYYPGDAFVDVIGISAYNFGTCFPGGKYETPAQAMDPYLNEIRETVNNTKPFVISQTAASRSGCAGDQAAWIRTMMDHLSDDPNVVGFIWFNFVKGTDFRAWTGSSLSQGWKDGVNVGDTAYKWPLTDWFAPGELTVGPPAPEVIICKSGPCDTISWVDGGSRWGRLDAMRRSPGVNTFYFGNPGDVPFMGDWNGDGVGTPGLYRQSDGFVYVRHSNTQGVADVEFFFGNPGDVPLVGDFNGDGRDSVSIWRASEARVYVINELGAKGEGLGAAALSYGFGNPGDVPFVGDFDGDGIDTIGLYRQSTGFVYFRNSLSTGNADLSFFYGDPGDQILAGDWDGDGDDTVAVYRPSTGRVYINLENAAGAADWDGYIGAYPTVITAP